MDIDLISAALEKKILLGIVKTKSESRFHFSTFLHFSSPCPLTDSNKGLALHLLNSTENMVSEKNEIFFFTYLILLALQGKKLVNPTDLE